MKLREWFGLDPEMDQDQLNVNLTQVTMPMDIALQLVFRQQQQLFQALSAIGDRLDVVDHIFALQGEKTEHLHKDVVELQQVLEGAAKHPVERADDVTDEKVHKKDERPN